MSEEKERASLIILCDWISVEVLGRITALVSAVGPLFVSEFINPIIQFVSQFYFLKLTLIVFYHFGIREVLIPVVDA